MCSLVAKGLILFYQFGIAPYVHWLCGPSFGCRFTPTCSQYALQAIETHGPWRGMIFIILRLSRCHPFSHAGYDPVPHDIADANVTLNSQSGR